MRLTSFSSQPRPTVPYVNSPIANAHISSEHLANSLSGLVPLFDFLLPRKGLPCPNSMNKQMRSTPSHVERGHPKRQFSAPSLRCSPTGCPWPAFSSTSSESICEIDSSSSSLRSHHFPTSVLSVDNTRLPLKSLSTLHPPSFISFHSKERGDSHLFLGNLAALIYHSALHVPSLLPG